MHTVSTILDCDAQTTERLFYVVMGLGNTAERFMVIAVFSQRSDVEAYTSDDPDLVPGSLVAQQLTFKQLRREVLRDALVEIDYRLLKLVTP